MLHFISWVQFSKFIVFAVLVYYGWLVITYYGDELKAFIRGRPMEKLPPPLLPVAVPVAIPENIPMNQNMISPAPNSPNSASASPGSSVSISTVDKPSQLQKAADTVMGLLKEALKVKDNTEKLTRDEIVERANGIVSNYRYLKETKHETSINIFLAGVCREFQVELSSDDLIAIWN